MAASTTTYRMWKRLADRPGGSRLFSVAAMARVPYFASILPHVVRMEPGFAEVKVPKWVFVHNHLHTVHAIASCNAAEIAMGMLMEATVPTTHRWIPKAMNVRYLEKATTSLRAQARLDPPDCRPRRHHDVGDAEWLIAALLQIRAVAFTHEAVAAEREHLVDQLAAMIAVVDHQSRYAAVDIDELELQIGLLGQRGHPVVPERGLATHHSPALRHHPGRHG